MIEAAANGVDQLGGIDFRESHFGNLIRSAFADLHGYVCEQTQIASRKAFSHLRVASTLGRFRARPSAAAQGEFRPSAMIMALAARRRKQPLTD
jgi:hypothetical protein